MFQTKTPRSRHTIGLLAGWPVYGSYAADRFVDYIAQGLQKVALEQDCNLLLGLGVNRLVGERSAHAAWPVLTLESDFVPVGPWNTDGLIVLAPIRSEARTQYLADYASKGFPIVYIGSGGGRPTVMVDNRLGIRQAVEHLIEHGHKRIAFLAGDTNDPGDSAQRLEGFHQALQAFKLEDDPGLIKYGYHNLEDGYRATMQMLREGQAFSAVVASNDMSAIGAIQAIREQGLRVPQDIAVIGFDDQPMAAGQDPPLSSVHYPLFEAGYQAGGLLIDAIKSRRALGENEFLLPPRLSLRHSCGCSSGSEELSHITSSKAGNKGSFRKAETVRHMAETVSAQVNSIQPARIEDDCARLTSDFVRAVHTKDPDLFHSTLSETLSQAKVAGESLHVWQEAITILSKTPVLRDRSSLEFANMLLHRARVEISESIQHQQEKTLISQNAITHQLSWLSAYLFAAHTEAEIVQDLSRLPLIGIRFVHVGFFEPQDDDQDAHVRSSIPGSPQTDARGPTNIDRVLSFPTREFPAPGIFPEDRPYHLAVLPLVFQEDAIGFVVFESSNLELYAAIVRELAAAIKSAELHARVLEMSQTDGLTKIYNRRYFEGYLAKELERSRRYDRPLAVAMLDLDHFKAYNDTYGHQAGDLALQTFSALVQSEIRRNLDIVARYGGEEFVIVMPEADLASALRVAERIRVKLESLTTLNSRLTTSVGVAAFSSGQPDWHYLISLADQALYVAKNHGGNQVQGQG